jgi:hypothetical protein
MAKKTTNSSKKRKVPPKEVEQDTEEIEKKSVILADDDSSFSGEENASVSTEEDVDGTSKEDSLPETKVETKEVFSFNSDGKYHNKQRCLILCTRGVTSRYRHLLEDLRTLIPHHKKDSKLDANKNDAGGIGRAVNDIAEMRGCNSVLLLECRKRQDAYLWVGHTGGNGGPSAKFLVENIHTMDELRLTGNCMKGSRPILTFDSAFQDREELKLLKCLFTDVFGSPRGHPKSKPFIDRVMSFYYADGKVSNMLFYDPILLRISDYIIDERMSDLSEDTNQLLRCFTNTWPFKFV